MEIPFRDLTDEALSAIIEEYITREGTEYGEYEYSLARKVEQIKQQLRQGEIVINFDSESETCHLVPRELAESSSIDQDDSRQQ